MLSQPNSRRQVGGKSEAGRTMFWLASADFRPFVTNPPHSLRCMAVRLKLTRRAIWSG
jgi:hypothetical protein